MLMGLEDGIPPGVGWVVRSRVGDVQMDSLAGRTWEAAQVLFEVQLVCL